MEPQDIHSINKQRHADRLARKAIVTRKLHQRHQDRRIAAAYRDGRNMRRYGFAVFTIEE
jgi:hypothetical protein